MNLRNTIEEYLKNNVIYFDGAFGTYYYEKYDDTNCEIANIDNPKRVEKIHDEYARAGANILCCNTFSANKYNPLFDEKTRETVIKNGFIIANDVSKKYKNCYPCADIGPISTSSRIDESEVIEEYKKIIDIFIDAGAKIFVFETMSNPYLLLEPIKHLRKKCQDAYIICQFAVRPDGYTKNLISIHSIVDTLKDSDIDCLGLNCASGPMHMLRNLKELVKVSQFPVSALPNAGSPRIYEGRQLYTAPHDYFGEIALEMVRAGARLVGGCCGTNPKFIKRIVNECSKHGLSDDTTKVVTTKINKIVESHLSNNLDVLVEMAPPKTGELDGYFKKCELLEDMGVKNITLPDSPLAITRMNSSTLSTHIKYRYGLNPMPHMCCRDKNIIGIKSDILSSYSLGVRNVLCITGDPVAAGSRDDIKSVYNLSSISLIKMIKQMNLELAKDDPINIYAAVNFGAKNFDSMIKRSKRKIDAGAIGFLSQPIFQEKDVKKIEKFKKHIDARLYVGIMPPVSYKNALFLDNEVPGISIPQGVIDGFKEIKTREDAEEYGCNVASDIAKKALEYADGLYIIPPFGRVSCVSRIINNLT